VHLITGLGYPASILLIGGFTLVYTYIGGLKAVVAMDVVQMFIYLGGAAASMFLILHRLPHGWQDVAAFAASHGQHKFAVLNTPAGLSLGAFLRTPYTLLGGVVGGTFMTMASHGTDQLLVQRLLSCRTRWDAQRALLLDASFILVQFAFFLVLGLCLYAFYGGVSFQQLGLATSDEVFPKFIVENLPTGLAGLVVAGVLASAMGTLSSSISSLASSTYLDLFKLTVFGRSLDERGELRWSRVFTLLWGILLIGGAMLFRDTRNPVVELGLRIASVTYGGLLGAFFLGLVFRRTNQTDATVGFLSGLLAMIAVLAFTKIDYTWHTLIGCAVTILAGNACRLVRTWAGSTRAPSALIH
jgi:Na+/proline symporter